MSEHEHSEESIQQRIDRVLGTYRHERGRFGGLSSPEEVDWLEYELARAEAELREVQARVDELRRRLGVGD